MIVLTSTWPNFPYGKFSVCRKIIVNGGAIRPTGLLYNDVVMKTINFSPLCFYNVMMFKLLWFMHVLWIHSIVSCNVTSKQNKHTNADRPSDGLSGTLRLYWDLWCWSIMHINTHTIHFLNFAPTHYNNCTMPDDVLINFCSPMLFRSAVKNGSGAFLMPSCLSSVCQDWRVGGGGNLRSTSVTFSVFWHGSSLGWH